MSGASVLSGADLQRRGVTAFLLVALMLEMVFFIVLGPLLGHYKSTLHISTVGVGLLGASYSIGCGLAALPCGVLVGRLGARSITLAGLALVGAACTGFALGRTAAELDAARIVQGVGAAALWAGAVAWLVALGGERRRGRMIGLAFAAAGVGGCVGPALGALASIVGTEDVFLALGGVILALAAIGAPLVGSPDITEAPLAGGQAVIRALSSRETIGALAIVALPSAGFGVAGILVPLRLHDLGASASLIAAAYVVAAVIEVFVNPLVGSWYDSAGAPVLRATLLTSIVGLALLALPLGRTSLLVALATTWPAMGAVWVPALARLSDACGSRGAGAGLALGLFNACWAVTQASGSLAGAQLAVLGAAVPFLALIALYALGLVRGT